MMADAKVQRAEVRAAGDGEKTMCFGVEVTILLTGVETDGRFALCRIVAPPGTGAPPHVHVDGTDETFSVVSGEFEIVCGQETFRATAGTTIFLPHGVPHLFRCYGDAPAEMLSVSTPAGHEAFFRETNRYTAPPSPEEAQELCRRHGMELLI